MSVQVSRRFQVTFASLSDATVLVQTIQGYCVCTPVCGNGNQQPASMPPPPVVPTILPSTVTDQGMIPGYEISSENSMSHPSITPSIQRTASSLIVQTDPGTSLAHTPSAQPLQSYQNVPMVHYVYPLESQMLLPSTGQTQISQLPVQTSNVAFRAMPHECESSLPSSSLPLASWSDPQRPASTSPEAASANSLGPIIVSVAKLYQLPVDELESAVADILREPGFEEFVCILPKPWRSSQILIQAQFGKLDEMWALHGFMRR